MEISVENYIKNYIKNGLDEIEILESHYYKNIIEKTNLVNDRKKRNDALIPIISDLCNSLSSMCLVDDYLKNNTKIIPHLSLNMDLFRNFKTINEILDYPYRENIIIDIDIIPIYKIIDYYLYINLYKWLIQEFRIVDSKSKTPISLTRVKQILKNIKDKNSYVKINTTLKEEPFYELWKIIENYEIIHKQLNFKFEDYLKIIISKTDSLLINIFKKHITFNEKLSRNKRMLALFPLYSYIMPHRKWINTEIEFRKSKEGDGKTYEEYKIKIMQRFLYKDKKK